MARQTQEPPAVDASRPNAARISDLFLGGMSGFGPDRDLAARVEAVFGPPPPGRLPVPQEMSVRNRLFQGRAVSWAARQGVRQVIDLGCGYPVGGRVITLPGGGTVTLRDTHEAASGEGPARTVYVDSDPMVVAKVSAAAGGAGVVAAEGDLSDPAAILADPVVRGCVDLAQPCVLLLGAVLQLWDARSARAITSEWLARVVPGSVLAVSVPRTDDPALRRRAMEAWAPGECSNFTRREVEALFTGARLIDPGVVPARGWGAGWRDFAVPDSTAYVLCGVGIKQLAARRGPPRAVPAPPWPQRPCPSPPHARGLRRGRPPC